MKYVLTVLFAAALGVLSFVGVRHLEGQVSTIKAREARIEVLEIRCESLEGRSDKQILFNAEVIDRYNKVIDFLNRFAPPDPQA